MPQSVFDPQRWEKIAGPNWRKVVYVLNRGGRFQEYKDIYKGDLVANQYKSLINIYQEKTAGTKNAFTGKSNPGYATYVPISTALGKSPKDEGLTEGYLAASHHAAGRYPDQVPDDYELTGSCRFFRRTSSSSIRSTGRRWGSRTATR